MQVDEVPAQDADFFQRVHQLAEAAGEAVIAIDHNGRGPGYQRRHMFFDAADPRQAGRMAAARTFVSGNTGTVFNTPFALEALSSAGIGVRLATEVRQDLTRKFPHGPSEASLVELFQ